MSGPIRVLALLFATAATSACGNEGRSTPTPASGPAGQLVLSEPLYGEFGSATEPNPARSLRLLHQVRGLGADAREAWWRALDELDPSSTCFLAIAGIESMEGSEPLLEFYDFPDRQREVRELFPLYPAVWIGGLPYRLDAFDFVVDGRSGGSILPPQPEDIDHWVRRGRLRTKRAVADDPLAAMDAFLRSPEFAEFERRFVPERGIWTAHQRAQHGRAKLREQAYLALGGILDRPLRLALRRSHGDLLPTSDEDWRVACRVARECQVRWNPTRQRFEWSASVADLVPLDRLTLRADVQTVSGVLRQALTEAGLRISEDRSVDSDRWFRADRTDGARVRAFVRWLPATQGARTELEIRGIPGKSEEAGYFPEQAFIRQLGLRERFGKRVLTGR